MRLKSKALLERFEFVASEGFGEDVCKLVLGVAVGEVDLVGFDLLADEVTLDVNVLGACVVNWVFGEGDC